MTEGLAGPAVQQPQRFNDLLQMEPTEPVNAEELATAGVVANCLGIEKDGDAV
jgi:hypothetical protein